jgi:hypothetical protein
MQNNLPVTLFLSQNALFSGRIPPPPPPPAEYYRQWCPNPILLLSTKYAL